MVKNFEEFQQASKENIDLAMKVDEIVDGSHFDLAAEISGGLLNGPVGRLVAKVLESDVHKSISNLATLR